MLFVDEQTEALKFSITKYLHKPVSRQQLKDALEKSKREMKELKANLEGKT